jgi:transcriptional regulator with XRE-family HTH domain
MDSDRRAARASLTTFLRARRERSDLVRTPLVFPERPRRRPGLTRSELARRAGISLKWYTLVETGRASGVSQQTVDAIANALELEPAARLELQRLFAALYPKLSGTGDA